MCAFHSPQLIIYLRNTCWQGEIYYRRLMIFNFWSSTMRWVALFLNQTQKPSHATSTTFLQSTRVGQMLVWHGGAASVCSQTSRLIILWASCALLLVKNKPLAWLFQENSLLRAKFIAAKSFEFVCSSAIKTSVECLNGNNRLWMVEHWNEVSIRPNGNRKRHTSSLYIAQHDFIDRPKRSFVSSTLQAATIDSSVLFRFFLLLSFCFSMMPPWSRCCCTLLFFYFYTNNNNNN